MLVVSVNKIHWLLYASPQDVVHFICCFELSNTTIVLINEPSLHQCLLSLQIHLATN